jgi:hypothetical protein
MVWLRLESTSKHNFFTLSMLMPLGRKVPHTNDVHTDQLHVNVIEESENITHTFYVYKMGTIQTMFS